MLIPSRATATKHFEKRKNVLKVNFALTNESQLISEVPGEFVSSYFQCFHSDKTKSGQPRQKAEYNKSMEIRANLLNWPWEARLTKPGIPA